MADNTGGPDGEDGIDGATMEKTTQMASTAPMMEREKMVMTAQKMKMELTEMTVRMELMVKMERMEKIEAMGRMEKMEAMETMEKTANPSPAHRSPSRRALGRVLGAGRCRVHCLLHVGVADAPHCFFC